MSRPLSSDALSILLAGPVTLGLVLAGCATRTSGIEVELMIMPLEPALARGNVDLGMSELGITEAQLVPCPTIGIPQAAHTHASQGVLEIGTEPVAHTMNAPPGSYCDLRLGLASAGVVSRETVLRIGCADGRTPVSLDEVRRHASLVMTFPTTLDVPRLGEADIDRQRTFDALVRGVLVERIDCDSFQP